ncbi:hypothetical protein VFPPC_10708 [Pochonia chlamydosporia 170]|uniref:Uncharacterized protein n=1 Tax=Pochonia chlamydosporia 170 TaxID=1380566 RepID=A0A179F533_METCM|nr:hypothetical protein VFPPC_10708 [Pochonia chlamydosporia 170]OAQ60283.1 hypothetical protein VFPPC_10708 [Pochonia chlamydosporia 170]
MKDVQLWTIVHASVTGFAVIPIILVGILTVTLARRRGDPARRAFVWLKGCYPLLIVSLSCIIAADSLNAILNSWQNDAGYYDTTSHTHDQISSVIRSERYLSFTGNLFEHLVDILFVIILVELGNGLMYSLDRQSSKYQTRLRYTAYGTAVVLFSLALAYFGHPTASWVAYWNGSESNSSYAQLAQSLKVVGKLGAAFYIPSWIISIFQIGYASFVMHKHKAGVLTRHAAILYLTITVLDFIRWTFFLILYAQWILPAGSSPAWWDLIDALGNTWIRFSQLVMLLIIGMRRKKGIWTTHQPWMASSVSTMASTVTNGPSPVMAPGAVYQHSLYPHKEYSQPSPTHPAWYMPQQVPSWQYHELAAPSPVIIAPRELDASMTYQYAPHPMLGPGYLVLQSSAQIQQNYQQQLQQQQQQHQQQQPQPSHHTPRDYHSLPTNHQLHHQPSFQLQQYNTQ